MLLMQDENLQQLEDIQKDLNYKLKITFVTNMCDCTGCYGDCKGDCDTSCIGDSYDTVR